MLAAYGLFGVFAIVAVAINVAMIFGVLSLLNATLTLPGIIGIVLTIGIAVDSNVLIYERIREEVRAGRTAIAAIDAGFTRALATILDSNITTFIAAAVLFFIGTGPVRGFAVTLGIGIITTVFTAFTLTRLIVAYWVRWSRPQRLADHMRRHDRATSSLAFRFCGSSRTTPSSTSCASGASAFRCRRSLSIVAIVLFSITGLNFGIDFVGGTLMEVQAKAGPADLAKMRTTLGGLGLGEVQLQQFGAPTRRADPRRAAAGRRGRRSRPRSTRSGRRSATRSSTAASRWSARASRASCWPTARSA